VAEALASLNLDHVVVTSVARDDLADGGAAIFAATIRELRALAPDTGVEVLIPDFDGREEPLRAVMEAAPDIVDHNLETVHRLQKPVRKRARWDRSLEVIRRAKEMATELGNPVHTKSSLMVGLGEEDFTRAISGVFPQIACFAVGNKPLAEAIVGALNELKKNGFYDKLLDTYGVLKIDEPAFAIKGPGPA